MSQYIAEIPAGGHVKPEICAFYELFYEISDDPSAHERYADMFTDNARLIMASSESNGRAEIIRMRHGMWEKVAKRSHKPRQIFPFGGNFESVMLYGTVDYELKDGKKTSIDWAARSHFVEEGGKLRMDFYQVYLDTAAMARAK